jgi:hypothetical protein
MSDESAEVEMDWMAVMVELPCQRYFICRYGFLSPCGPQHDRRGSQERRRRGRQGNGRACGRWQDRSRHVRELRRRGEFPHEPRLVRASRSPLNGHSQGLIGKPGANPGTYHFPRRVLASASCIPFTCGAMEAAVSSLTVPAAPPATMLLAQSDKSPSHACRGRARPDCCASAA